MKIIRAEKKHIDQIVELWKEMADFHADRICEFYRRTKKAHLNYRKHVSGALKNRNAKIFVALEDGKVLGYTLAFISKYPPVLKLKKHGFIADMAVTKVLRRKGTGKKLLERVMKWFRERGMKKVELGVAAGNPAGYPFWKKHGFKEIQLRLYRDI
jgi:GNAT superfamily N-acetyltransferase